MAEIYLARELLNPEAAALMSPLLALPAGYTLIVSPLSPPRQGKDPDPLALVLAEHGVWLVCFQPLLQPQALQVGYRRAEDPGAESPAALLQRRRQELERYLAERRLRLPQPIRELLVVSEGQGEAAPRGAEAVTLARLPQALQAPVGRSAPISTALRHQIAAALQPEQGAPRVNQYQLVVRLRGGLPPLPHLAYDTLLDRPVQLDEFPDEGLGLPGHREALRQEIVREAKLTMQLHHENVNRVEQVISQDDRLWMVTEWNPGSMTLREWLQRHGDRGVVPPQVAVAIVLDLCKALEYAHDKRVIHRHVRPENVLILPNGRAKLTSFGLAKHADMGTRATFDLRQMIKENPYAAPEFHLGKEGHHQVDGRVDIYSLGVIFYELLTGALPSHLDERFWEPPSRVNRLLGEDFDDVIGRALRFDPAQRFSTVGTMRRLLEKRPEAQLSAQTRRRYGERRLIRRTRNSLIFAAEDTRLGRPVAVKKVLLPPGLPPARRSEALQQLLGEAQLASRLHHPNIVQVFDYFVEDDDGYVVMEFVEGPTLRETIEREGALDLPILIDVLDQLLEALAYAHEHGALHRDIKPENIVYHQGKVTLLDFGVADAVQGAAGRVDEQRAGGTARYMAPEQLQDLRLDERADIFALGVLMYELLTRHYPYSPDVILGRFSHDPIPRPVPPSEINLNVPAAIDQVVLVALELEPELRFQSVAELQEALAGLGREPAPAAALAEESAVPWVEVLAMVAGALVLVTVIVVAYTHVFAPRRGARGPIVVATAVPSESAAASASAVPSIAVATATPAPPTPSPTPSPAPPTPVPGPAWAGRAARDGGVTVEVSRLQPEQERHTTSVTVRVANNSQSAVSFLNRNDRPEQFSLNDNLGNDYSNLVDLRTVSPELLLIQPGQVVSGSFQVKDGLDPAATSLVLTLKEAGEAGREFPLTLFRIEPEAAPTASP